MKVEIVQNRILGKKFSRKVCSIFGTRIRLKKSGDMVLDIMIWRKLQL